MASHVKELLYPKRGHSAQAVHQGRPMPAGGCTRCGAKSHSAAQHAKWSTEAGEAVLKDQSDRKKKWGY